MRSSGPTCSIFCFDTSGRTHSNSVFAPHSAHTPMAHPSPYRSRGLSRRRWTDLVASVSWLSSVAGKASPAPERVTGGHKGKVPGLPGAGRVGNEAETDKCRTEGGARRSPGLLPRTRITAPRRRAVLPARESHSLHKSRRQPLPAEKVLESLALTDELVRTLADEYFRRPRSPVVVRSHRISVRPGVQDCQDVTRNHLWELSLPREHVRALADEAADRDR